MSFERYKADVDKLAQRATLLSLAMRLEIYREERKRLKPEALEKLPKFTEAYQSWYSEALACVEQLLPSRREDFVSYYKPLKTRKSLDAENYTISDYLRSLSTSRGPDEVVGLAAAALQPFRQQVKIVEALKQRFESSLFDIRALVQADLFENELDAAASLNRNGYARAAGAMAGVVLEEHLGTVCEQHQLKVPRNASISKLNDTLKEADVLDVPGWRFIQHLGDLRNLCDHKKQIDPTNEQIQELLEGVRKISKTVF